MTERTRFLLPALRARSTCATTVRLDELYLVDLDGATIERAVRGRDGADADGSVVGTPLAVRRRAPGRVRVGARQPVLRRRQPAHRRVRRRPARRGAAGRRSRPSRRSSRSRRCRRSLRRAACRAAASACAGRRAQAVRLRGPRAAAGRLRVAVRGRVPDADGRLRGGAKLLGSRDRDGQEGGPVTVDVTLAKRYRGARCAGRLDRGRATVELDAEARRPAFARRRDGSRSAAKRCVNDCC